MTPWNGDAFAKTHFVQQLKTGETLGLLFNDSFAHKMFVNRIKINQSSVNGFQFECIGRGSCNCCITANQKKQSLSGTTLNALMNVSRQ